MRGWRTSSSPSTIGHRRNTDRHGRIITSTTICKDPSTRAKMSARPPIINTATYKESSRLWRPSQAGVWREIRNRAKDGRFTGLTRPRPLLTNAASSPVHLHPYEVTERRSLGALASRPNCSTRRATRESRELQDKILFGTDGDLYGGRPKGPSAKTPATSPATRKQPAISRGERVLAGKGEWVGSYASARRGGEGFRQSRCRWCATGAQNEFGDRHQRRHHGEKKFERSS